MGLLGKIIVRAIFATTIVLIIASGLVSIGPSIYDTIQAVMVVFAIMSADILIEKYLSRGKDEP